MSFREKRADFIAKEELKKKSREIFTKRLLLTLSLISILLIAFIFVFDFVKFTGYLSSVLSSSGEITELVITSNKPVTVWGGFYGLVLRVPTFTEQLSKQLDSGTIERSDIFFDCVKYDSPGGPEVYASTNPNLNLLSGTVIPGTVEAVDDFIGCSNQVYCANKTYTNTMSVVLGSTNITGIPSTNTYKYNGENQIFDVGILNVSGSLVFVSHINETIQKGYNPNFVVNYQMLLPIPENDSETYYFYPDPFDICPSGGIGNTLNGNLHGYVFDALGNVLENVSVSLAGFSNYTNSNGFYNISASVLEGNYSVLATKSGYATGVAIVTFNSTSYIIEKNITLEIEKTSTNNLTVLPFVEGFVKDVGGNPIVNVSISLGNATTYSDILGYYSFYPLVVVGQQPLIAIKENYDNYYSLLSFISSTSYVNHNITMDLANLNQFPTGPFTQDNIDDKIGDQTKKAKSQAEQAGQDYWVSTSEINKQVRQNTFIEDVISIYNFKSAAMNVFFSVSSDLDGILKLEKDSLTINPASSESSIITISGTKPVGIYRGELTLSGDLQQKIPVKIEIVPKNLPVETLVMELSLFSESVAPSGELRYKVNLQNLLSEQSYKVDLDYLVLSSNGTRIYLKESESVELKDTLTLLKKFKIPENLSEGEYLLEIDAKYKGLFSSVNAPFNVAKPLYLYSFFGIPLWIIFIIISAVSLFSFGIFAYKRGVSRAQRYHLALDLNSLPKPGDRSIKLGFVAETKKEAFYNLDDMTTHAIVAGATGGGKSISAQVFVEEALLKGIGVVVFDPTAQWSGMLRKCDDKKMMSFYPKFGLKANDAKAFPGNVRQVTNERQSINISKYIRPGQIQIFTLNKLTPPQIDIFVAGVISNIFKSDPQEYPQLKTLIVFDEVHRLLPKFGGSGKGFLQIERACREFRKWGLGVMLVSQVLSDFVGEIKANINTEVQMRVAEEKDLERIKERYGEDALKSLVRADVGTGMIQNAEYNKGRPYFVNLRPILHSTRRLSDDILSKYNSYNEVIDDLEYQVEQLEAEKVDIFDLKMELKLIKDKLMTGNFTVVDIYLEGLRPRLLKQWESIHKKPKKKEVELINVAELENALAEAAKKRNEWADKEKKSESAKPEEAIKQNIGDKIVAPLTFDNGIMISSLKELKDTLPNLDKSIFKESVNDDKNDISDWAGKNIDAALGKKLSKAIDKESISKILDAFLNPPKEEDKEKEKEESSEKSESAEKAPEKKEEKESKEKPVKGKVKKK